MNNSLPYKILYSDGNEGCTKCYNQIRTDCLQIGIMMQSDDEDCQYPQWYHQACFFKTRLPRTEAAFDGFALLRYTDQLSIRDILGTIEWETAHDNEVEKLPDFFIEYSKTSRDFCLGCDQMIKRSEIRIMKVIHSTSYATDEGKATWYHVLCFARYRHELNWLQSAESLPGFRRLFEEDKLFVSTYITLIKRMNTPTKNRSSIDHKQLQLEIKSQSQRYYELYEQLENVTEDDRFAILYDNNQFIPKTKNQILHHLTDVLFFGRLDRCSKCESGQLIFDNSTYICTKEKAWDRCDYETKEPYRRPMSISERFIVKYPFLILYNNAAVNNRVLHCFRTVDENGNDLVYGQYKHPPLFNMEFAIIGNLARSKDEIERTIKRMGGKVAPRVHYKLAAVISNRGEVEKMSEQMMEAKAFNIQVVTEEFLVEIATNDPLQYIVTRNISNWGNEPKTRIERIEAMRAPTYYTKSVPKKITFKWKDRIDVDPECGLGDRSVQVYKVGRNKYHAILACVDILTNRNSYYRLQLLESKDKISYWVFEASGRISTNIGSKRLTTCDTLDEAKIKFQKLYEEKTGNRFGTRMFCKQPNKFYHLDIDLDIVKKGPTSLVKSRLDEPVFELMEMLFDTKQMEKDMGFDLDLKQMPLGKIDKKQIHSAMRTLADISTMIVSASTTLGELREATNQFYTLIPHAFGVERPRIIDSLEVVREKNEMLEGLLNMEMIYGFLNEESGEKVHPSDACYYKLKCEINHIAKDSPEFRFFCDIVRKTHGHTHSSYTLEVLDIFRIARQGEEERFMKYQNYSRALLWHGSRIMNFVSILSTGLKVAPPEAIATGYMFGKGIYFADVVSKSANYCHPCPNHNIGLILMCEVALGNMKKLTVADSRIGDIPNNQYQSVGGVGTHMPIDWKSVHGVIAPCGPIQTQASTSLLYNEYVVYDPAQVKIKYLFKVRFDSRQPF
ncbi:Poly [ADP-ribose] polymerase [Pseudolycoriella hygida]|uniref:Poly [ADP-ribose] polymerase n=1 Tax=Pseudolycoriella hygida TaxID=35572 RepID=A0A9Q0NF53_9DIPT|nr:Poly [ADP-ribose] polymerase [Pseudolycoriella hygida]